MNSVSVRPGVCSVIHIADGSTTNISVTVYVNAMARGVHEGDPIIGGQIAGVVERLLTVPTVDCDCRVDRLRRRVLEFLQAIWLRNRVTRTLLVLIYVVSVGKIIAIGYSVALHGSVDVSPWILLVAGVLTAAGLVTMQWRHASRPRQHDRKREAA